LTTQRLLVITQAQPELWTSRATQTVERHDANYREVSNRICRSEISESSSDETTTSLSMTDQLKAASSPRAIVLLPAPGMPAMRIRIGAGIAESPPERGTTSLHRLRYGIIKFQVAKDTLVNAASSVSAAERCMSGVT
jgi:hypothetical protein